MPTYRLCSLNPGTDREIFFNEFEADDDKAAIAVVERGHAEAPIVLWCGDRMVSRFDVEADGGRSGPIRPS